MISILKIRKNSSNIYFKKNVSSQKILLTISVTQNFTFKIGNSRVVEIIFPEEISHDL